MPAIDPPCFCHCSDTKISCEKCCPELNNHGAMFQHQLLGAAEDLAVPQDGPFSRNLLYERFRDMRGPVNRFVDTGHGGTWWSGRDRRPELLERFEHDA